MTMHLARRLVAITAAITAACGVLFASTPASASPTAPSQATSYSDTPGILATAPSCVTRNVWETPDGFDVQMHNTCTYTVRVKVIVDWGGDSGCYTIAPGNYAYFYYEGVFGQYNSLVTC